MSCLFSFLKSAKKIILFTLLIYIPVLLTFGKSSSKRYYKSDATLIEAYTQRTLPGRKESNIRSATHIIIIWHNKAYPKQFFWVDNTGAMNCNFGKVHKAHMNTGRFAHNDIEYVREGISLENIKPGDTLDITTLEGNNTAIPDNLPGTNKNTLLYYQQNEKKLFAIKVDSLARKHDIIMP